MDITHRITAAFLKVAKEQGHELELDENGKVNTFAVNGEFHNGPYCVKCHTGWCLWCDPANSIKPCSKG